VNLWAIIPLASCISFSILFILVLQQTKTRMDRIFALFFLSSAVWSFTSFMLTSNFFASTSLLNFWNGLVYTAFLGSRGLLPFHQILQQINLVA